MLVVTRSENESITLDCDGQKIRFVVRDIRGSRVSIGIDAPRGIKILRTELLEVDQEVSDRA